MDDDNFNELDEAYATLRQSVWMGFSDEASLSEYANDLSLDYEFEPKDGALLHAFVKSEIRAKKEMEVHWPAQTECDTLIAAFDALRPHGIFSLHCAGYTMSDGHNDALVGIEDADDGPYHGYVFYHGQDVQRALEGHALYIAFDSVEGGDADKVAIAQAVVNVLRDHGLNAQWNGNPSERIYIEGINWKWRTDWKEADPTAAIAEPDPTARPRGFFAKFFGR